MYKKFIFTIAVVFTFITCGISNATSAAKDPAGKPVAKSVAKQPAKTPVKAAPSEDEKYAQVYEKCTKEAEANEAKYDSLFNSCMDKNGFPQEEYETGGQPMPVEGQDN